MNEVRAAVRRAARRFLANGFLRALGLTLSIAVGVALAARIAQQLFGLEIPWREGAPAALGAALVAAAVIALALRPRMSAAARELDERAGLRESLSTALAVEKWSTPWAQVVVETARSRAVGVDVRRAVPLELPRRWYIAPAMGLAFVIVWYSLPTYDLLGKLAKKDEVEAQRQQVVLAKAQVAAAEERVREALAKAGVEIQNEKADTDQAEQGQGQRAEEIRRAAVKKLTEVSDRLSQMREGEKARQLEAVKQAMQQLRTPGPGPLNEFARNLARGDFQKAQQALAELARKAEDGSLSDSDRKQLQDQAAELSRQLDKLAQKKDELSKMLEQAGLDKQKAEELARKAASGDPEQMKKALEELKSLPPELQKEGLLDIAKAMAEACKECSGLSAQMGKLAQAMSQSGNNQQGQEALDGMMEQLSQLEQLQGDMAALDSALGEIKSQLAAMCQGMGEGFGDQPGDWGGIGEWREGDTLSQGAGSGGPGRGMGRGPEEEAADFSIEKTKANVKTTRGAIIGSRLVYGEQVRGESVAGFGEAVEAASREATEAIEAMQVRREHQNAVKHYFGRLDARVKSEKAEKEDK